jgi:phospholipid/cholesterol/gamma-HCH transport system substrate-binding protein
VEREAKYAAVGLFALLTIALAFAFVWWYSDASDRRQYERYEIHFFGTVSGLSEGSPVRYLGVDVGRVRTLRVDAQHPRRVKIMAEIDSTAPISGATEARLGLLGLTGLLFIDLQQDPLIGATTPLVQGDRYPLIRSRKGDIEVFLERLPDAVMRAGVVLERVERLLDDKNLAVVASTLENIEHASDSLPELAKNGAALASDLRSTSAEVRELSSRLNSLVDTSRPDFEATLAEVRAASGKLSNTAATLDRIIGGNEASLSRLAGAGGAGELQQLMIDVRTTSSEIRALAAEIREEPSRLLREGQETGVEIPR